MHVLVHVKLSRNNCAITYLQRSFSPAIHGIAPLALLHELRNVLCSWKNTHIYIQIHM